MMKKYRIVMSCLLLLLLSACSGSEKKEIETYGITDTDTCENLKVLEANKEGLMKDKGSR